MVVRREVNRIVNPLDEVETVAREQARDVEVSLLQSLFGVERGGGALQLAKHGSVARDLRAVKTRAQSFELVKDFLSSARERVGERRIEAAQFFMKLVESARDRRVRVVERACDFRA